MTPISRRVAPSTQRREKAAARASPPCARRSRPADTQPPIDCASNCPSRCFGQIKQARGFRQFLVRGLDNVAHEWGLVCLNHNMLKLAQGRSRSAPMLATA